MHEDLRRRALESKKTTSRKSRTKAESQLSSGLLSPASGRSRQSSAQNSPSGSNAASRAGSAAASRAGSEDEADFSSDEFGVDSIGSIDGFLGGEGNESPIEAGNEELSNRINKILTHRKRSSAERVDDLKTYYAFVRSNFEADEIAPSASDLCIAFMKMVRESSSESLDNTEERPAIIALKSMSATILISPQGEDYVELCASSLKTAIASEHHAESLKAEAIHTLALIVFLCGTAPPDASSSVESLSNGNYVPDDTDDDSDVLRTMNYLTEIITTDGENISTPDSAKTVSAAISAHALLTSRITSTSILKNAVIEDIVEPLVDQLTSSAPTVNVAAGEHLALLYEKSYRATDVDTDDPKELPIDEKTGEPVKYIKLFDVYRRKDRLLQQLRDLAKSSSKKTAKSTRRTMKENLADVAQSVERPWVGPRFVSNTIGVDSLANTLDGHHSQSVESAEGKGGKNLIKLRVDLGSGGRGIVPIDTWWKLLRLKALQSVLSGNGIMEYWWGEGSGVKDAIQRI